MKIKFDFILNPHYCGVVEQTIFKLVLRGIHSAQGISELLWIFSDEVKAIAIQKLVNNQLLHADLASNKLYLSDGITAIIGACHNCVYMLEIPEVLLSQMDNGILWINDKQVVRSILNHILPNINVDSFSSALSFNIREVNYEGE